MTPAQEKALMLGALQQLDAPKTPFRLGTAAKMVLWLVLVVGFIAGFQLFGYPPRTVLLSFLAGAATGAVIIFAVTANVFGSQLLVLCRHIDRESVKSRLHQLGA